MSALPSGWESDYDGSRWFYRYRPTGQVQFHFPQDGDEFPDFVDAYAPAPDLAPEEKLESQQQVKRKTEPPENNVKGFGKSTMRATAGPSSGGLGFRSGPTGKQQQSPTDDDDEGAAFYYQPESFMFLGPGAYSDVSPLADEDDRMDAGAKPPEKGKQNVSDNIPAKSEDAKQSHLSSKVSPIQGESTTPLVIHSTPVVDGLTTAKPSLETQHAHAVEPPAVQSPTVPMLDSREMPHELPASSSWNPIGVVAEMPTEHTAQARAETHPEPVEIGDGAVLAPIETHLDGMHLDIAELPEHTSPTERKAIDASQHDELQQTSMPDHVLYQATFGTIARPKNASPPSSAQDTSGTSTPASGPKRSPERQPRVAEESHAPRSESPFKIARKPTIAAAAKSKYQPYAPAVAASNADRTQLEEQASGSRHQERRISLMRDGSLMLGSRESANVQAGDVPAVLQPPQIPPKVSQASRPQPSQPPAGYHPAHHHIAFAARQQTHPVAAKYGRQSSEGASEGSLSHVPSVLKPARGKMVEQNHHGNRGGSANGPPHVGQIQHAPTMDVSQQPALGPRPSIQRVSTAPPSQPLQSPPVPSMPRLDDFRTPSPKSQQQPPSHDWSTESRAYQNQVISPSPGRLPRQQSFASSEVSSLGPSSSRQSSIGNLQTPSPQESLQRRTSNMSGFFAMASGRDQTHTRPNTIKSSDEATEPFPAYTTPTREPGARPASFSGSLSSLVQTSRDLADANRPVPPKIPQKIPFEHATHEASRARAVPSGHMGSHVQVQWPAGQQLPNAIATTKTPMGDPQRRGTTRRHSLPQEETSPPQQHPGLAASAQQPGGGSVLPQSSGQPQARHPPSAPFHWTYPASGPGSGSQPPPRDTRIPHVGSSAPAESSTVPPQPAERPPRPSVGTNTQQPSRPSVSTPVQSPGHALLPIEEQPESDQGRSTSQPVVPVHRQYPVQLPRPGQIDRAATTLPVVQQPPPRAREAAPFDHAHQSPRTMPPPQPQPQPQPQPAQHPMQQPMAGQQFVMMAPPQPLQHHQRSYSSPLGVAGFVGDKEKEKEKGGWFSKFKKGSQKPSVLQKQPPRDAQPQQPQVVQQPQQPSQAQYRPEEIFSQEYQQTAYNGQHSHQGPYLGRGNVQSQRVPAQITNEHPTGPPALAQTRVQDPQASLVRSSSDTIREASPIPPSAQSTNLAYPQPAPASGSDLTRTSSHSYAPTLDRQASVASSYAASISTVDIAEAYEQPIMKPQLITVQRATTAPLQQPQQSRASAVPALVWSEQSQGYFPAQQVPQEISPRISQQVAVTGQLAPAPHIASGSQSVGAGGPSTQALPQRGNSKWTKRPAADYSGGDWGDDNWGN